MIQWNGIMMRLTEETDMLGLECGAEQNDDGKVCPCCGGAEQRPAEAVPEDRTVETMPHKPEKEEVRNAVWVVFSVLLILFGLDGLIALPLGIAALVFAVKIGKLSQKGDPDGAKKARSVCLMLLIAGAVFVIAVETVAGVALYTKYLA